MKTKIIFMFLIAYFLYSQEIKVMTFNIRYENQFDGVNNWDNRKNELAKLILNNKPDILGLQEVLINQLNFLNSKLTDYSFVGTGREDGKEKGEFAPIFYYKSKYELIKFRNFWLSENEDTVSKGWDASLERICSYCILKDLKTNDTIHVFNTHFDHAGSFSRLMSAKLILKKISNISNQNPLLVLMGDFNSESDSEPVNLIKKTLKDSRDISKIKYNMLESTFNGFRSDTTINKRIDFIFVKNFEVNNYSILKDKISEQKFISDHYPVISILRKK